MYSFVSLIRNEGKEALACIDVQLWAHSKSRSCANRGFCVMGVKGKKCPILISTIAKTS